MDYYYGNVGGTEKQVLELIRGLDKNRYIPYFAVLKETDYIHNHIFPCKVKILNIQNIFSIATTVSMSKMAWELYRLKNDIVHVFFNDAAIIAPFFCKLTGSKVITSRRDMGFWYTPSILKMLRLSHYFVDRIVANSKAVKDNVIKMERVKNNKIDVVYNGIDDAIFAADHAKDFRERHGIKHNDLIVGSVSNLYSIKRPRDIINVFKILYERMKNVHLVLVGGGHLEIEPLKQYARELSLNRNIHFIGRVWEPIPIIKYFDVCISCSESEGLSNAILEYMGCGKPVVCTDVGGNPELVIPGYNGFIVKLGEVNLFAKHIIEILSNKSLRIAYGENSRKLYLNEFTSNRMVIEYMALYDKVLSS